MFGLSKLQDTITGLAIWRGSVISTWTLLGAEAVNAINGTLVKALKAPILVNAVLKSWPLQVYVHFKTIKAFHSMQPTIWKCDVLHL